MTTLSAVKFLGTTDEVTTCDCCGRKNLKNTVALELDDGADPVFYGVTCAAHALKARGITTTTKDVRNAARAADRERARVEAERRDAVHRAEDARWQTFLNTAAPQFARSFMNGPDRFKQLEALGGYAAARAKFAESEAAAK